jgi:hypothetical protein
MRHSALVALGILVLVASVTYAVEAYEVVAANTAQAALERAIRLGDEDLVPKRTLAGARVRGVLTVHHPQTLEPVYGLAPALAASGDLVAVIGIDTAGERALWYRFGNLGERFPMVSSGEAQARASRRAAALGRDAALGEPILIAGCDKHLYWRLAGPSEDIWLIDIDRPDRDVLGTAIGNASQALSPDEQDLENQRQRHIPLEQDLSHPPAGLGSGSLPATYDIPGIPHHYQITSWYCGPASLQMMFDYHAQEIGQHDISDVADDAVGSGCTCSNMVRSAHFSGMSSAIQNPALQGYSERQLGYYCEEYWWGADPGIYDEVKELLCAHYPIFVCTWYDGSHGSGHFRVLKGYDDNLDVWVIHDPWYYGSMSGPNLLVDQTFFVENLWLDWTWCWGMIAGPWGFRPSFPSSVTQGDTFSVDLTVYYPGPVPFDNQISAYSASATISLSAGLTLDGGSPSMALPNMQSGDSATVSWDVIATGPPGEWGMAFQARGTINYSSSSYSAYSDTIGGHAYETVEITGQLAAGWESEERITNDDAASETCFPSARAMVVGTDGTVHLVWQDTRGGASNVYYQGRVAEVWQPEVKVTCDSGFCYSPCVAVGPEGSIHVAWAGTRDGNHEIYYRAWTPGGGWGAEERVTNYGETDLNPSIAAGDSLVYLAWESRQGGLFRAHAVFFSVRNNLGWSAPIDVDASPSRDSFRPSMVYGPDGLLHMVYERHTANDPTEREKIVHKSWDGTSWSSRTGLSSNLSYSRTPVIASGADSTLHVVWQDGENGNADIFYIRYDGSAWQTVEQLAAGGTEASTPSVAVDGAGAVHVVWVDHRHPETEIYYLIHDGSGWSDEARLTNAPGASLLPTVAATTVATGPYVAWTDLRHGNAEVYFRGTESLAGIDDGLAVSSGTGPIRLAAPYPMPFTSNTTVAFWLSRPSQVSLAVFDVQGRLVRSLAEGNYGAGGHQVQWDGRGAPACLVEPGVYFLRCSSPLGQTSRRVVIVK